MTYGGGVYAATAYAGAGMLAADIPVEVEPRNFAVEVSFTTDALATPAWKDISADVRSWDVSRGRTRELERFQPGRCTVVLDNSSRDYDSQHATGPHFGDLRPMRRIRIRETFNGVTYPRFDGFVDRWNLDYPEGGQDAIATVEATDAWKIFARTELARSVYVAEVETDAPVLWWRCDEDLTAVDALNHGSLGTVADGTYISPIALRQESLVVNDPGASMRSLGPVHSADATVSAGINVAAADFEFRDHASFAVECWVRGELDATTGIGQFILGTNAAVQLDPDTTNARFVFSLANTVPTIFAVEHSTTMEIGVIHHVVCKMGPDRAMAIYVDGVKSTTSHGGSGTTFTGTMPAGDVGFAYDLDRVQVAALLSHFAVYSAALGVDPLPDDRVSAHFEAGSSPWQGDIAGERAARVLDLADWPADLRELDDGETTFQSAALDTTVLEHLQKVAETEAGALFMHRNGNVRLIDRDALAARVSLGTFGDLAPEIGYRSVTFDDGDATIRNTATISRLNGVARTDEDAASVDEFGRFQYTLDGLLHNTDAHSTLYAGYIVDNYAQPQRRVIALELGPASAGQETALYDQILGRELGDKVTVKVRHPDGTGVVFSQDVVIEGMQDRWDPHGFRSATWTLSPAPGTF